MEEEKSKALYKEEIDAIVPCTAEEMMDLFLSKDEESMNRLVEGNLYRVYEAASYFSSDVTNFMDLVQEGNMALFLFLTECEDYDEFFESHITAAIHNAMQDFADLEEDNNKASEELKVRLNVLDEVCVRLASELNREATAEEVAEAMQMDVEDVRYLMKIALSAITKED